MKKCILFCIATVLTACANKHSYEPVRERVSLSGEWETTLGACNLPGTTDENRLGSGEHPKNVTHQLTRTHPFYGKVIYEKDITIPDNWKGKRMVLFMERTKPSTLWIDGDSIGSFGHI
ncbi:MAG: glycoside hydrolase, partial [Bacteroidaceae bacterium]|nr:glycoside hydrolase [Bacteroidaceae bacterium]